MDPERLKQIERLYRAAAEQDLRERNNFLANQCGGDPELREQVEALFALSGDPTATAAGETRWGPVTGPRADAVLEPGTRLGPYEIVCEIGKGGMGTVYRALDTRLDRPVAVKVCIERFSGQFEREARAIASLNHANICTLYDIGPNYLIMELVEGETVSAALRNGALPLAEVARYGAQIADALAAAHARGIIHRDLKPSNIMITAAGIKLLDYGTAKLVPRSGARAEETASEKGAVMGTLAYMAPEQVEGNECDARTDIFALGLVLYEMASGNRVSPPFSPTPSTGEALRRDPSPLDPLSSRLARIVRRCLAKDPAQRWQSAAVVKLELERLQAGILRRRHAAMWGLGIGAMVLIAALATMLPLAHRTSDEAPQIVPFTTYAGGQYEPSFSPDGARLAFVWDGGKGDVFNIYTKLVSGGEPLRITGSTASEGSPAWSPDGSRIAFLRYAAPADQAGVYIVGASGGAAVKLASTLPVPHIFDRHLDWSPDGRYIAVSDKQDAARPFGIFLISPDTGERRRLTDAAGTNTGDTGPCFSPDSRSLSFRRNVSAGVSDIYVVPVGGGRPRRITNDNKDIAGHAFAASGREIIFSSNRGGDMGLWRAPTDGGEVKPITSLRVSANFLAISRRDRRMAFSHWFVDSNIWHLRLGSNGAPEGRPTRLIASTREDRSPEYSPDGAKIAFRSDRSGWNEIWIADSDGSHVYELTHFRGPLTGSPHWSPDGRSVAFDSRPAGNGDIFMVPAPGGEPRRITYDRAEDVTPSWSNDGRWIYFASNRTGTYQVWKIAADSDETRGKPVQVTMHGGFFAMERRSDGTLFYAKGIDRPGIWKRTAAGEEAPVLGDFPAGYWAYWSVSGRGLYFVLPLKPDGGVLQLLDLTTRSVRRLAEFPHAPLFSDSGMSISRDGLSILYAQPDTSGSEIMLVENFR
jgi:Tol biopolymer transport system component